VRQYWDQQLVLGYTIINSGTLNGKGIWPVERPAATQIEHCCMYLGVVCYYYYITIVINMMLISLLNPPLYVPQLTARLIKTRVFEIEYTVNVIPQKGFVMYQSQSAAT
jgi:hypothetical protein